MEILSAIDLSSFRKLFSDDRFTANLVTVHGAILMLIVASLLLRRLLREASNRLKRWSGLEQLGTIGQEAVRNGNALLFWLTVIGVLGTLVGGVGYHLFGRDIREDMGAWYQNRTVEDFLLVGGIAAKLAVLAVITWIALRVAGGLLPGLEARVTAWVGAGEKEETLSRCFRQFEGYIKIFLRLAALWVVGRIVGLGDWAALTVGFVLEILTILVGARLLTQAFRIAARIAADCGDRRLGQGPYAHYWERISRLFPLGERCFEAAIYIWAASLCVFVLSFIPFVVQRSTEIVECIGIFFGTRVLIELLYVLLHEAFGRYAEEGKLDQKRQTLVPLIHSLSQYVLYFGSGLMMLRVLEIDTTPILAGAGILGLGVGLGAQSLVTDVVSGFFILFESQYLVGDYISVGDATGTVEEVGIRVTHIRDGQGKLHIIPNGQIKGVVSYSKGYVNAVVDYRVPSGSDLQNVFRSMTEAGKLLRQIQGKKVLADTEIHGVIELGTSEMTVRAVTKVMPGTHGMMQNEYRRLLKQVFDQAQAPAKGNLAA